jgi:hypothetical protein
VPVAGIDSESAVRRGPSLCGVVPSGGGGFGAILADQKSGFFNSENHRSSLRGSGLIYVIQSQGRWLPLPSSAPVAATNSASEAACDKPRPSGVAMLTTWRGIAADSATKLWSEGLSRHFANRRQVAAFAGFAPTPWQSGGIAHEQGVSKAGNPRLRATMVQIAWLWLRHQPQSALALVFCAGWRRRHQGPQESGDHSPGP